MAAYSVRRQTGNTGESIACKFLERKGFRIVARNYLRKWGEIDIVAVRDTTVHFIEVKSARIGSKGGISREKGLNIVPEELVTREKLRKLARTAALYMEEAQDGREYQIDVVGVLMDPMLRTAQCRLFEQALEDNL